MFHACNSLLIKPFCVRVPYPYTTLRRLQGYKDMNCHFHEYCGLWFFFLCDGLLEFYLLFKLHYKKFTESKTFPGIKAVKGIKV